MVREVSRRRVAGPQRSVRRQPLSTRRFSALATESAAPAGRKIELNVLGSFALRSGGRAVRTLPKKAQALLAYLALHRERAVSREQLADLLWGRSGGEHARRSLRQCLMSVRASLNAENADALLADADDVKLSSDEIDIDAASFEALGKSNDLPDLEAAAALYRGEFLSGLSIVAEPFADWLAIQRRQLAASASDVLFRLASGHMRGRDHEKAIAVAGRLTGFDPLREDAHRLLMEALAVAGRRSDALKQHAQCVDALRRDLGVSPEPATVALAEDIRRGLVAEGRGAASSEALARDRRPRSAADAPLALPDKPSIALLPLSNLGGDPDQDYFADGMADDLTIALGRIPWLFVIASTSTSAYRGHALDLKQIGAELGVRYVLRGSVRRSERRLRVILQLSDATDGRHVWSDRFEGHLDDIFAIQDRVTAQVSATIAPALQAAEIERTRHQPTDSLTAYDLYLRAAPRFRTSLAHNLESLKLLLKAIDIDPAYGGAYGFASRCYQFQKMFGWKSPTDPDLDEGVRLGHMAAELGQNDSEALWMAGHALSQLSGETEHGLALIERSLELNPNSANAWMSSCGLCAYLGQADTAIEHYRRAQRLNPLDSMHHVGWNLLGMAYLSGRDFTEAERSADKALRASPAYPPALRVKIIACGMLGRIDEGREHVKRLLAVHPDASVKWLLQFWGPPMRSNPGMLAMMVDGARRSGLPEG